MKIQLSVDRFEGSLAVLVGETGEPIEMPKGLLPAGTKAGDVLSFLIERDPEATAQLKADTKELQDELSKRDPGGDLAL